MANVEEKKPKARHGVSIPYLDLFRARDCMGLFQMMFMTN
jgi:hypothetical protein